MPADTELSTILNRRQNMNDALDGGNHVEHRKINISIYSEFAEFSRKEIKDYEAQFQLYNESRTGVISLAEVKQMMEKLGAPQTNRGLKKMIKEVDKDGDGAIAFREFLNIFRKARAGELDEESGLGQLAKLSEIDVDQVGVGGAKAFFEAKIEDLSKGNRFQDELREEKEEIMRQEEEKKKRQQMFRE